MPDIGLPSAPPPLCGALAQAQSTIAKEAVAELPPNQNEREEFRLSTGRPHDWGHDTLRTGATLGTSAKVHASVHEPPEPAHTTTKCSTFPAHLQSWPNLRRRLSEG